MSRLKNYWFVVDIPFRKRRNGFFVQLVLVGLIAARVG
jgi:hypothetical protein